LGALDSGALAYGGALLGAMAGAAVALAARERRFWPPSLPGPSRFS
jgi:hypothetical protein